MQKESLKKTQDKIAKVMNKVDIPITDKIELLINIMHFLDVEKYEENIKILSRNNELTKH